MVPPREPVDSWLEAARAAHPGLPTGAGELRARLARYAADDGAVRQPVDLVVAAACALGDPAALVELDRLLDDVRPAIHGIVAGHELDEVVQALRADLLHGSDGGGPRIGDFAGRGPLRAFLRMALVRAALTARRAARPLADEADWLALPALAADPSLVALRRRCTPVFRSALEQALQRLAPRERTVLREHLVDGLSGAELAALHRVHRATALRWIAEIKGQLVADVREQLARALGLRDDDLDSLVRSMRSQLAVSVERVLAVGEDVLDAPDDRSGA